MKVRRFEGVPAYFEHKCAGCKTYHIIAVDKPFSNGAKWQFNGNTEKPTFTPSVNITMGKDRRCHYFITDGIIKYCADSTHSLAGRELPLEDIEDYDD